MNADFPQVLIEPIAVDQARPLRAVVLRPGYPFERSIYPQDDHPQAYHAGARLQGELVGVATIFPEAPPWEPFPGAWRLRGMAVLAPVSGLGIGKQIVLFCLEHIRNQGGSLLWCNARLSALPFYRGLGFRTIGEEFLSPESGPHFQMYTTIPAQAA